MPGASDGDDSPRAGRPRQGRDFSKPRDGARTGRDNRGPRPSQGADTGLGGDAGPRAGRRSTGRGKQRAEGNGGSAPRRDDYRRSRDSNARGSRDLAGGAARGSGNAAGSSHPREIPPPEGQRKTGDRRPVKRVTDSRTERPSTRQRPERIGADRTKFQDSRRDSPGNSARLQGGKPPRPNQTSGSRGQRASSSRRESAVKYRDTTDTRRLHTRAGPEIDVDVTGAELSREARAELRTAPTAAGEAAAQHLVMAGRLVDDDPELAYEHARAARRLLPRLGVVREAVGLCAYATGRWAEALAELRAHRRMSGSLEHLPIMADCERGLGRPERALTLANTAEAARLDRARAVEMRIVVSGARRDLGQFDAAVVSLQGRDLDRDRRDPWSARLFYAYADALLAAGRPAEAREWFVAAALADTEATTDADERLAQLDAAQAPHVGTAEPSESARDSTAKGASSVVDAESVPMLVVFEEPTDR